MQNTAGCSHYRWEFYFSPIKYAIPIPIPIPISSPKTTLIPMGIPWKWEFPFPCTPLHRMRKSSSLYTKIAPESKIPLPRWSCQAGSRGSPSSSNWRWSHLGELARSAPPPSAAAQLHIIKLRKMRSVERGICPIATSIMNDLFQ